MLIFLRRLCIIDLEKDISGSCFKTLKGSPLKDGSCKQLVKDLRNRKEFKRNILIIFYSMRNFYYSYQ